MDAQTLQTLIVALIVAVAIGFMGRRIHRAYHAARERRKGGGCGGSCCS